MTKQRADFLVVEEGDAFDLGGCGEGGRRGAVEEGLDGGPGAELVVNAASEDEFFGKAAELGGLDVEEFEFPVYDGAVWMSVLATNKLK